MPLGKQLIAMQVSFAALLSTHLHLSFEPVHEAGHDDADKDPGEANHDAQGGDPVFCHSFNFQGGYVDHHHGLEINQA